MHSLTVCASKPLRQEPRDRPIISGLGNQQRWLGLGLLVLGIYFVFSSVVMPYIDTHFPHLRLDYRIRSYLKTAIIAVLLIGGGIKLMTGSKKDSLRESAHIMIATTNEMSIN